MINIAEYDFIYRTGVRWLLEHGFSEQEAMWISAIRLAFIVDPEVFM